MPPFFSYVLNPTKWSRPNLLQNGSFEEGAFPPAAHAVIDAGDPKRPELKDGGVVSLVGGDYFAIPGWSVELAPNPAPKGQVVAWLKNGNVYSVMAALDGGDKCLDLTGYVDLPQGMMFGSVVTSSPVPTAPGSRYTLQLQLGSQQGDSRYSSPVGVYVNTKGVGSTDDPPAFLIVRDPSPDDPSTGMQWTTHKCTFTATADSTWIAITGMNRNGYRGALGLRDSAFIGLDDVSLRATPVVYIVVMRVLSWFLTLARRTGFAQPKLEALRKTLDVGLMPHAQPPVRLPLRLPPD
jgi:hypothetical protein